MRKPYLLLTILLLAYIVYFFVSSNILHFHHDPDPPQPPSQNLLSTPPHKPPPRKPSSTSNTKLQLKSSKTKSPQRLVGAPKSKAPMIKPSFKKTNKSPPKKPQVINSTKKKTKTTIKTVATKKKSPKIKKPVWLGNSSKIHIVTPYDCLLYVDPLKALINSLVLNAKEPDRLVFHLLVLPEEEAPAKEFVEQAQNLFPYVGWNAAIWKDWLEYVDFYHTLLEQKSTDRRRDPHNLARIYLPRLLPLEVDKIISLDTDMVFNTDVADLWHEADLTEHPMAVVFDSVAQNKTLRRYMFFNPKNVTQLAALPQLVRDFAVSANMKGPVFSAGMFVANLTTWRRTNASQRVQEWGRINSEKPVFMKALKKILLNVAFHNQCLSLPDKFNPGLCQIEQEEIDRTAMIHFSGRYSKAWLPEKLSYDCSSSVRELWKKYFESFRWPKDEGEICRGADPEHAMRLIGTITDPVLLAQIFRKNESDFVGVKPS
eukprot:TRINITY_DN7447_c0_g1_i1.p1 TRINITY_DN7447_c0_g1~~TRINITY_DN7447_c0_g1_i1.p1  ORF type:complete len:485 (+),score=102.08 TRINITY_DN7447_c0_g1_i1:38-1492(+)